MEGAADINRELVPADRVQLGTQHTQCEGEDSSPTITGSRRRAVASISAASMGRPPADPGEGLEQPRVEFAEIVAEAVIGRVTIQSLFGSAACDRRFCASSWLTNSS